MRRVPSPLNASCAITEPPLPPTVPRDFPEAYAEAFAMLANEDVESVKQIWCWKEPVLRFTSANRAIHPKRSRAFQIFLSASMLSGW